MLTEQSLAQKLVNAPCIDMQNTDVNQPEAEGEPDNMPEKNMTAAKEEEEEDGELWTDYGYGMHAGYWDGWYPVKEEQDEQEEEEIPEEMEVVDVDTEDENVPRPVLPKAMPRPSGPLPPLPPPEFPPPPPAVTPVKQTWKRDDDQPRHAPWAWKGDRLLRRDHWGGYVYQSGWYWDARTKKWWKILALA